MRSIDKLISMLMWASIAATVPVIIGVTTTGVYKTDWRYTLGLCLLWLPAALSLGQMEDAPSRQPPLFYFFAGATFAWIVGLVAYGFLLYDGIP
jgi:hypothetical protein